MTGMEAAGREIVVGMEIGAADRVGAGAEAALAELAAATTADPDRLLLARLVLEASLWLVEAGDHVTGMRLHRGALDRLEAMGGLSRFERARHLDVLAATLVATDRLADAEPVLADAITRSETDDDLDHRAHVARLARRADLLTRLGREEAATTNRARVVLKRRRSDDKELAGGAPPAAPAPYHERAPAYPERAPVDREITVDVTTLRQLPYTTVPVHFATHRKPHEVDHGTYDPYDRFGSEPADGLHFGIAQVTVPLARTIGSYPEPGILAGYDPEHVLTITSIDLSTEDGLTAAVRHAVAGGRRREMMVFLHGYRTTLAHGLMRAAQLKVDMRIDGAVVLYSLPSKGTLRGYADDRTQAERELAHEHLRDFLTRLARDSGATRIHVVAHSLGCEMLVRTLNEVWKQTRERLFHEVIFASPDVDHQRFVELMPRVAALARRVTVYSSNADIPVGLVSWMTGRDRAGLDARRVAGIAQVEAVDTTAGRWWLSSFDGSLGHWDFVDEAVDDVRAVVWLSLTPAGRRTRIVERRDGGVVFWAVEARDRSVTLAFRAALEWVRDAGSYGDARVRVARERSKPGADVGHYGLVEAEIAHFEASVPMA